MRKSSSNGSWERKQPLPSVDRVAVTSALAGADDTRRAMMVGDAAPLRPNERSNEQKKFVPGEHQQAGSPAASLGGGIIARASLFPDSKASAVIASPRNNSKTVGHEKPSEPSWALDPPYTLRATLAPSMTFQELHLSVNDSLKKIGITERRMGVSRFGIDCQNSVLGKFRLVIYSLEGREQAEGRFCICLLGGDESSQKRRRDIARNKEYILSQIADALILEGVTIHHDVVEATYEVPNISDNGDTSISLRENETTKKLQELLAHISFRS